MGGCWLTPCDRCPYLGAMLPDGFTWERRIGSQRALVYARVGVAVLLRERTGWVARLDWHLGRDVRLILRPCQSFETGRAGIEQWAERHQDRLRAEIAQPHLQRWRMAPDD